MPETRLDRNPDGSYEVTYGNLKKHAKDQKEANQTLVDLMKQYHGGVLLDALVNK